ncbi:hypothetical protein ElyMa_005154900 [Elysia marginata]|uniref:Uncharacterized protein n=1 Tax=Elysia marginata TaxID=1093978 RepID=A0AAV4JNP5_9GAST|nr:hypothetical protein ElyMa_005154900 [Elysia marginata]
MHLLGYRGEKREEYLKQEFKVLAERAAKKEELEAERAAKKEEAERPAKIELKKMRLETAMKMLQAKIQAGIAKDKTFHNTSRFSNASAKHPKLPHFQERKDDLDVWLTRFERFAESNNWSRDKWSSSLRALLPGRALDCYRRNRHRTMTK